MGKKRKKSNMTLRYWGFRQGEASAVVFDRKWLREKKKSSSLFARFIRRRNFEV